MQRKIFSKTHKETRSVVWKSNNQPWNVNIAPYCHKWSKSVEKDIPFVSGWVSTQAAQDKDLNARVFSGGWRWSQEAPGGNRDMGQVRGASQQRVRFKPIAKMSKLKLGSPGKLWGSGQTGISDTQGVRKFRYVSTHSWSAIGWRLFPGDMNSLAFLTCHMGVQGGL